MVFKIYMFTCAFIVLFLLFSGCSNGQPNKPIGYNNNSGTGSGLKMDLKLKIENAAPSLKLKNSAGAPSRYFSPFKNIQLDWSGNTIGDIFITFRNYDPVRDAGQIDAVNIYNAISSIDGEMEMMTGTFIIKDPKTVAPTFVFDDIAADTPILYDYHVSNTFGNGSDSYYVKSLAYTTNGSGVIQGVIGLYFTNLTSINYGCTRFDYHPDSGDIYLWMGTFVGYLPGAFNSGTYGIRSKIQGNINEHKFFLHVQKGNDYTNGVQLIGYGVSQGSNSYYVMFVTNSDSYYDMGYYQINATNDENWFEWARSNHNVLPTNVNGLVDDTNNYRLVISNYLVTTNIYQKNINTNSFSNGGVLIF